MAMHLKKLGPDQFQIVRTLPASEGYSHSGETDEPVADLTAADLKSLVSDLGAIDKADGSISKIMGPATPAGPAGPEV